MYKPIYIFIGLRYLYNHNLPNFKKMLIILSIVGISISISSIIITISIINGIQNKFKNKVLSFIPHIIITNQYEKMKKSDFPEKMLKLKNIENITDFISKKVIIKSKNEINMGEIIGINKKDKNIIKNYNIKNIFNTLNSKKNNIIIGIELFKKLNIHINDKITLILLPKKKENFLKNHISVNLFQVTGVFSTNSEIDNYQILMNRKNALNFFHYNKNYITGWRIWLKNPLKLDTQKIKNLNKNFIILDWKMKIGELFQSIEIEKYIMFFFLILILLIATLNMVISLIIYVLEKKYSIVIFQSQGLSNYKIMLIFIILSSILSIIGNFFGTILSIILIIERDFLKFLINIFFFDVDIPIIILPTQILIINLISILITVFSTLYPIWHIVNSTPSKILSHE
ncbi:FtsX-like permease family protein [Buchnera aphidicola]|uniref:FtsX-like permease family protein n=1 Tax=Buchnera aphidicola TaxID=9 RepID=UPI00346407DE